MKVKKTTVYIGLGVSFTALITYLLINRSVKKKKIAKLYQMIDENVGSQTRTLFDKNNPDVNATGAFPLRLGSRSKMVKQLQQALADKYNASIPIDGAFGEETAKAICKYVFTYCYTWMSGYRDIRVNQNLFNDILKGQKRTDKSIPTSGFSGADGLKDIF